MYKFYYKETEDQEFTEILEPKEGCWIHCESATIDDLSKVAELLEIDTSELQDTLDLFEIPRVEKQQKDVNLIFTRYPFALEMGIYTTTLTIIHSKNYIITVTPSACPMIQKLIANRSDLSTTHKSKLLFHILRLITQEYTRTSKHIRAEVISHGKDLNQMDSEDITDLTVKEEYLNQCVSTLAPLQKVIQALMSGRYILVHEKEQDLLEDLYLASCQSEDLCQLNLRMLRGYRNSVQISFSNQFNKTIKLLTALTIILNFPTMISSLYGMNVALPFEGNPFAFIIIVSFIAIVSLGAFFIFQRRRWL